MRIEKVYLKDIGPFGELQIDFAPKKYAKVAETYLLVGPNGAGKSTILYAIAGALGGSGPILGQELLSMRMKSKDSIAAIIGDDECSATAIFKVGSEQRFKIEIPSLNRNSFGFQPQVGLLGNYNDHPSGFLAHYIRDSTQFQPTGPMQFLPEFSWAAFAYAGMRSIVNVRVNEIKEPTESPFQNSLSFFNTTDSGKLVNWILNQEFKRLKAKESKNRKRVKEISESIHQIEKVISKIIDSHFAFQLSDQDNNVRAIFQEAVIDLGLLPDGLKSILSWIADLLMRLDRIPWQDGIPILERSFLLLLDEIDIHLHPTWQRKLLPIVQEIFPNAQIIASTHSPFVVASCSESIIMPFRVANGQSTIETPFTSQMGFSYSSVLRSIFGITSEFDIDTENKIREFRAEKQKIINNGTQDRVLINKLADDLCKRSEELRELIFLELRQMDRQISLMEKG